MRHTLAISFTAETRLTGTSRVQGAKNGAAPIMAASSVAAGSGISACTTCLLIPGGSDVTITLRTCAIRLHGGSATGNTVHADSRAVGRTVTPPHEPSGAALPFSVIFSRRDPHRKLGRQACPCRGRVRAWPAALICTRRIARKPVEVTERGGGHCLQRARAEARILLPFPSVGATVTQAARAAAGRRSFRKRARAGDLDL